MRGWTVGAFLAAVLSLGSMSYAQTPSAQDRATARLLAEEADKKSEAGDFQGAIELFRRADAIFPAPSLKLAIARLLVKQKLIIEAHELLLDVARSAPQKDEPPVWASARESARQEAEEIAPRIAKIDIVIRNLDAGVEPTVTLDGQRVPNESLGVVRPINPGKHHVHVDAEGYMPSDQNIQMGEGEHYKLSVKMYREPEKNPEGAPSSGVSLPPKKNGSKRGSTEGSGGRTLAIIGFTSGGVFLAAGSLLGWMVSTRVDDIKKDCTLPNGACPLSRRPDADTAEQMALASNISFGLAVAGLGLGVYGLLSKSEASSAKAPAPWRVGVGPGSVAVAGSF